MLKPEPVQENDTQKILWDFDTQNVSPQPELKVGPSVYG